MAGEGALGFEPVVSNWTKVREDDSSSITLCLQLQQDMGVALTVLNNDLVEDTLFALESSS